MIVRREGTLFLTGDICRVLINLDRLCSHGEGRPGMERSRHMENFIVADAENALLICPMSEERQIKAFVEQLSK